MQRIRWTVALIACALSTGALAADVDGNPQVDSDNENGLFVWRTGGGRWQVRLAAGGQNDRFDGAVESTHNFSNLSRIAFETGDAASIQTRSVSVDVTVANVDIDGVAFDATPNADVCLRSRGANRVVYLGAQRVARMTPVSLTGPGACGNGGSGGADSGLFIEQVNSTRWIATLQSVSEPSTFDGMFDGDRNMTINRRISLEQADSVNKSGNTDIVASMAAWPGGSDGVEFSVANGGSVCVRSTTGSEQTIYLGTNPNNATAMTTPVDLTVSGACGSSPPPPPPPSARKYNVGHYVSLLRKQSGQNIMANTITGGIIGFKKRYTWRELEPSEGNYNFSKIASDLQYLGGQGMQLIVMIEDKTFVNENPMPNYLSAQTRANRPGGFTGVRWSRRYIDRMKALMSALGSQFDSNPAFEGVALQETAPGFDSSTLNATAYTPEKYRDALIEMLLHSTNAMPSSQTFWFMNFLPQRQAYIKDIAEAVAPSGGVVIGGPDVMPDDHALQQHTYPLYADFHGELPLFGQVEPICYHHEHADPNANTVYWTMPELFNYARWNLKVNYMFWVRLPVADYWNSYDYFDAVPVIQNNPTFN